MPCLRNRRSAAFMSSSRRSSGGFVLGRDFFAGVIDLQRANIASRAGVLSFLQAIGLAQRWKHPRPGAGDHERAHTAENCGTDRSEEAGDEAGFEIPELR